MLNCGCIVCDICLEKPFSRFNKQMNGQCPMCGATVFKDQSRTKIGGMMLCNKVAHCPPPPCPSTSASRAAATQGAG